MAHLEHEDRWDEIYVSAVEKYVRAEAAATAARERLTEAGTMVARGSQGQLVQHPDVKTMREAQRDAMDYARELLLTPAARKRHEMESRKPSKGKFAGLIPDS